MGRQEGKQVLDYSTPERTTKIGNDISVKSGEAPTIRREDRGLCIACARPVDRIGTTGCLARD